MYICNFCDCYVVVYAGSSLEVKIETDSNDAMEIKTEADSSVCPYYDHQITGIFLIFNELLLRFSHSLFTSFSDYMNFFLI